MKIKVIIVIIFIMTLQGCYTQVVLPKNQETDYKPLRKIEFYKNVVDTLDNNSFPDCGYYYKFRPDITRSNVINRKIFLEKLYSEGYNVIDAWYCPSRSNCSGFIGDVWPGHTHLSPEFIILLSDFNDSIIEYNFNVIMDKPFIQCPYNVEVYTLQ